MKKIKQLDIVFENCEVYYLTPDMIEMLVIEDVKNNIGVNCFQYTDGEVYTTQRCDRLTLSINQKGLNCDNSFLEDHVVLEKRLKFNDITHIELIYDDDTKDYISVPWDYKNEYTNELQNNLYYSNLKKEECLAIIINSELLTIGDLEDYGL